ncbi:hypothetical protein EJD97_001110 [Solanum chilense]|uniref:Integrase catalytic domain-containing protein n=1 Tax=Solanum chilense TaxID=4083 RepID=A0A6N2BZD7_SOLCI|nr:hypothetical protein EJD97_001110 [Solanum chilense]
MLKKTFRDRFFPREKKEDKAVEFITLRQGEARDKRNSKEAKKARSFDGSFPKGRLEIEDKPRFKKQGEQETSPDMVTGKLIVFSIDVYASLDPGATFSFFTPLVAKKLDNLPDILHEPFIVSNLMVRVRDLHFKILPIESVPIVREFSEFFPNDLPGIPPQRKIDTGINLLPDKNPIYIPPYWMDPAELKKLKSHIKDLLDKGFTRPSISSWRSPVDPRKNEAVKNWPRPLTSNDIRSFLGLSGYYRRLTKSTNCIPVKSTYSAKDYARIFIAKIVCLHGIPLYIVSDWGAYFTSLFWRSFHKGLASKKCISDPEYDLPTEGLAVNDLLSYE